MKRHLVISVDYEVFGNGTGDVRQHMVEPAERMAKICERQGAPLTVFFEAEEYLAFKREGKAAREKYGYDAAKLVEDQIRDFVERGHDIQLHLHPQWYQAKLENGEWRLDDTKQAVDDLFESQEETNEFLRERIETIMTLTGGKPVTAYRAGAFSAQPGTRLLRGLKANGVAIDSSVSKGLTRNSKWSTLDYRNAPCSKGPWQVEDEVATESPGGPVWEFPIYGVMRRRFHQLTWSRLRAKFSKNVPVQRQKEMLDQLGVGRTPASVLRFLFQPVPIKLDYHNLPPGKMLKWVKSAPYPKAGNPDVIVLIGHTKEHMQDAPLERFLDAVKQDPGLEAVSFTDVANLVEAVPGPNSATA